MGDNLPDPVHIRHVFGMRPVAQVLRPVIRRDSVQMHGLHACRRIPVEGQHDQLVNRDPPAVLPQMNGDMPGPVADSLPEDLPRAGARIGHPAHAVIHGDHPWQRPDPSQGRDLIGTFITRNIPPDFN